VLVCAHWKSQPRMSGTERHLNTINRTRIGLLCMHRVRGSRAGALTACPEASTIRVRVGARSTYAPHPGGRKSSLTTVSPAPVSTTAEVGTRCLDTQRATCSDKRWVSRRIHGRVAVHSTGLGMQRRRAPIHRSVVHTGGHLQARLTHLFYRRRGTRCRLLLEGGTPLLWARRVQVRLDDSQDGHPEVFNRVGVPVARESDLSLPLASTHGLGKPEAPFLQLPLGLLRHLRTGRRDAILLTAQPKRALSAQPLAPPRHYWCSGRDESAPALQATAGLRRRLADGEDRCVVWGPTL